MRIVSWLFVVSAALFVSGIVFVIAAARMTPGSARADAPAPVPVATIKEIMDGMVARAATVVFGAVGTYMTRQGLKSAHQRPTGSGRRLATVRRR